VIWTPISDKALARQMAAIFIEADAPYSMTAMKNAVDTMKLSLPPMGATERNLIGFSNGVFDTRKGNSEPTREDWLLVASEVEFGKVTQGETWRPCA
jgi:putative DNA primase/helicase